MASLVKIPSDIVSVISKLLQCDNLTFKHMDALRRLIQSRRLF